MDIRKILLSEQDIGYKEFHKKLMPTIPEDKIIGIRIPVLRKIAKEISSSPEAEEFMNTLPHKYYEENNLHAFLIEKIKDYDEALKKTEEFLPYVDNWATCDSFSPKVFSENRDKIILKIKEWLSSDKEFTVRYAIGLLMNLFLDEYFKKEYPHLAAEIKSDKYYIKMMQAWYFATALAKQYDTAVLFLEEKRLDPWVHNKAIQKAVESRRIDDETKKYLRTLKIQKIHN